MSDIIRLSYKDQEKNIQVPKTYSELKEAFLSSFKENGNDTYSFKYKDEHDDDFFIEDDEKEFNDRISEIVKIKAILYIEKMEDLDDLNEDNENNDYGNAMKSGMIFKKSEKEVNVEELNQRLKEYEKKNKELIEKNRSLLTEKEKYKKEKEETLEKNRDILRKKGEIQKKYENLERMSKIGIGDKSFLDVENLKNQYEQEMSQIKIQFSEEKKKCKDLELKLKENNEKIEKDKKIKENLEIKEKEILSKNIKINELEQKLEQNNKNIQDKNKAIEDYQNKIKNYEKEITVYKSELEKSKLDIQNLKKNNEIKDKENTGQQSLFLSEIGQLPANFEHKGIKCEKCFSLPIKGIRYKCLTCPDYNLCEKCEEENSINNFHDHDFIKIRKAKETKEKIYSYDCLNMINLIEYIYEGTQQLNMKIILKNNCKEKWPKDNTKLIFDKNSQITGKDIILSEQNIGEEKEYLINLKHLEKLKAGDYRAFLAFNVEGKNYGEKITLLVKIRKREKKDNEMDKYIDKIKEFRITFNLSEEEYPNEKTFELLKKNNFDFEKTFSSLFE